MSKQAPCLLKASGLVKRYDGRPVVDELNLSLDRGQVLSLLGPNGAGKTTTLRMLYGLIEPEAGNIEIDGRDFRVHRTALKRRIGVCTQDDTLDEDFTVAQNLEVYAGYFRPRVPNLNTRIKELLTQFGLDEYSGSAPITLSGGFKRRLMIARSMVHRPDILCLDEPTTGLDPKARVDVWELINTMRASGMGIILTTHYMDEAERLSDHLVVLSRGKDIARGSTETILGQMVGEHVLVVDEGCVGHDAVVTWARKALGGEPASILGELHVPVSGTQLAQFTAQFSDLTFELRRPTLDDLFLKLADEQ